MGGEPGIGTLCLQISLNHLIELCTYLESQKQIKMRRTHYHFSAIFLTKQQTQNIFKQIETIQPEIVIIDSIQTLHTDYIESTAGSISQIRETTAELIKFAKKETNIPVILIGHITKDGTIAGPKILEHMVVVLQFEGDHKSCLQFNVHKKGLDLQLKLESMKCLEADCVKYLTLQKY
jgi:DNA repair protein RadA/Sms